MKLLKENEILKSFTSQYPKRVVGDIELTMLQEVKFVSLS